MALSDREEQVLRDLEAAMAAEAPRWHREMGSGRPPGLTAHAWVLLGVLVGIGALFGAAVAGAPTAAALLGVTALCVVAGIVIGRAWPLASEWWAGTHAAAAASQVPANR